MSAADRAEWYAYPTFSPGLLSQLLSRTNRAVYTQRTQVRTNFFRTFEKPDPQKHLILITSGYGRLIRTVIKEMQRRNFPVWHFIHYNDELDPEGLNGRLLMHEIRNENAKSAIESEYPSIPSELGRIQNLVGALSPQSFTVVYLMGVEGVRDDRLMVSRGAQEILDELRTLANPLVEYDGEKEIGNQPQLNSLDLKVFALAEAYKYLPNLEQALFVPDQEDDSAIGNHIPWRAAWRDHNGQPYASISGHVVHVNEEFDYELVMSEDLDL